MKMSIEKILEKAFTTGDLVNGGLLNPDQSAKFVQGVIDKSVILPECRRVPMVASKKQIDKITYGGGYILQKPPSVGTAPTTTSKPTTSKVTLDAQEVILAIDLGYDSLEDSIEGENIFDTIMELTSKKVGLEMDILALNGDTAGGTGDMLEILDGIFKQVSSHTVDVNKATMSDEILFKGYKALPGKYVDTESDLRFYMSHLSRLDYIHALAGKGVNEAFVRYLLEAGTPTYQGVPVKKVPAILTEDIDAGTPVVNGSKGMLINPKNIVWGVHRDITYEFDRQPRKRIIEITMTMKIDFKLEEEDAVVKMTNIKHSV